LNIFVLQTDFNMDNSMFKSKLLFIFTLLFSLHSFGQVLKGKVLEMNSGEPMVGATVLLKELGFTSQVKLDGSFQFQKLKPGIYTLSVSYTGYKVKDAQVLSINFKGNENKPLLIVMEPVGKEMETVSVTSSSNASERLTRKLERVADPVLNILSAKTLQLLPDITVANAIQRVSGVTIEKSSSGEGRYPIIRGMEKRYINTLVNGIKIPSPDNKNRFIPLDLFPSELLERLEVSKSLTPSMEGDAIGGTINLQMKDAPMNKLFYVNVGMGYNSILSDQSYLSFSKSSMALQSPAEKNGPSYIATPADFSKEHLNYSEKKSPINNTIGVTFGNRIGADKKLGFIVSGSYQNLYRGTKSNFFLPNSQPGLDNIPLFSDLQYRLYSSQSSRKGLNAKLDYQINKNNKLSLTNTYVRLDDYQTRIIYDTVALNSLVNNSQRSAWQYQSIYNSTLQGFHALGKGF